MVIRSFTSGRMGSNCMSLVVTKLYIMAETITPREIVPHVALNRQLSPKAFSASL